LTSVEDPEADFDFEVSLEASESSESECLDFASLDEECRVADFRCRLGVGLGWASESSVNAFLTFFPSLFMEW
jgi:hypothetical protein